MDVSGEADEIQILWSNSNVSMLTSYFWERVMIIEDSNIRGNWVKGTQERAVLLLQLFYKSEIILKQNIY